MNLRVIIEEYAGQHNDLVYATKPPYCRCGKGRAFVGSDSCIYCGRYVRELFLPIVTPADEQFAYWRRFVRERPHEMAA